jgi:hypothetical protein
MFAFEHVGHSRMRRAVSSRGCVASRTCCTTAWLVVVVEVVDGTDLLDEAPSGARTVAPAKDRLDYPVSLGDVARRSTGGKARGHVIEPPLGAVEQGLGSLCLSLGEVDEMLGQLLAGGALLHQLRAFALGELVEQAAQPA